MGEKGQKWLSTSLQGFSFYLSLSICLSISHSQSLYRSLSFTIFLLQSFFHNLSFSIIPSQYFFDNLSFTVFLPHSFYHHLSFTIFFSQSVFIDLYYNLCKIPFDLRHQLSNIFHDVFFPSFSTEKKSLQNVGRIVVCSWACLVNASSKDVVYLCSMKKKFDQFVKFFWLEIPSTQNFNTPQQHLIIALNSSYLHLI